MEYTYYSFSPIGNNSLRNGFIIKIVKDSESNIIDFVKAFSSIEDADKNIYVSRIILPIDAKNSGKVIFDFDYISKTYFFVNIVNSYVSSRKVLVNSKQNVLV